MICTIGDRLESRQNGEIHAALVSHLHECGRIVVDGNLARNVIFGRRHYIFSHFNFGTNIEETIRILRSC